MAVVHVNSLQMSIEAKFFVMHITFVHVSSIILGLDFGSYATTFFACKDHLHGVVSD